MACLATKDAVAQKDGDQLNHLAIDHAQQLGRIYAELHPQLMDIGVMGDTERADVLGEGVDLVGHGSVHERARK
jgi:hypothetical protein